MRCERTPRSSIIYPYCDCYDLLHVAQLVGFCIVEQINAVGTQVCLYITFEPGLLYLLHALSCVVLDGFDMNSVALAHQWVRDRRATHLSPTDSPAAV
jgi:hypothetical protein